MTKKILLIGSGMFIEQTILPALVCLKEKFKVVGILNNSGKVSTTIEQLQPNLTVTNDIKLFNASEIDIIFMCIPVQNVPSTLCKLLKNNFKNVTLFVTTPVVPLNKLNLTRELKQFKKAYAFEFVPFLSKYRLARALIEEGKVGKFKKLWLNHNGYLYHGLATIRSFMNWQYPVSVKALKFGPYSEYQFKFANSGFAAIKEPKDYNNGSFLIAGTKGLISDYSLNAKNAYFINHTLGHYGKITGFSVNNIQQPITEAERIVFAELSLEMLSDKTEIRQLNIIAAAEVFNAAYNNDLSKLYSYQDTILDHAIIRIAKKCRLYFDPFTYFGTSILKAIIRK